MEKCQDLLDFTATGPAPSLDDIFGGLTPDRKTLRDYQEKTRLAFLDWYIQTRSPEALIALATGLGKTLTATACIHTVIDKYKGAKVLWVTHRDELMKQSSSSLEGYLGISVAIEKANRQAYGSNVAVASIQSLKGARLTKFAKRFQPDLIVFDEAHHSLARGWMGVKMLFPRAKVLNLTATPFRTDINKRLELGKVLIEINTSQGIEMGFLVPPKPIGTLQLNLSGVGTRLGDYKQEKLETVLLQDAVLASSARLLQQHIKGRRGIIFAASVTHGKALARACRKLGLEHVYEVYGDTPEIARGSNYAAIRKHPTSLLINNLCLDDQTEILTLSGWRTIDTLRDTDLVANWEQGRITFTQPQRIIRRHRAEGEDMYSMETRQRSIRVTRGHRMVKLTYPRQHAAYSIRPVEELAEAVVHVPVSGHSATQNTFALPLIPKAPMTGRRIAANSYHLRKAGMTSADARTEAKRRIQRRNSLCYLKPSQLSEDICSFIGMWVGDGTCSKLQRGGVETSITLSQSYPNIVRWMDQLCDALPFDSVRRPSSQLNAIKWSFGRGTGFGSQEREGIFPIEPYLHKYRVSYLWDLNEIQFKGFLKGLWLADGNHGQYVDSFMPTWLSITMQYKGLADTIQAVATCKGYKASVRPVNHPAEHKGAQMWALTLSPRKSATISKRVDSKGVPTSIQKETAWQSERVWCVEVPSSILVTRRLGTVTVMGNCLTEGFDLPELDLVGNFRPTKSAALYIQMIGRGLRKAEGKTDCLVIDAIDTAKKAEGKSTVPLPTDDDVRQASNLHGAPVSPLQVLLGWFFDQGEISKHIANPEYECSKHMRHAGHIFQALFPAQKGWMPSQVANMEKLQRALQDNSTVEESFHSLATLTGCRHIEAFIHVLMQQGWCYCPRKKLPTQEYQVEEIAEAVEEANEEQDTFSVELLTSLDPKLKHFMLNVIGESSDLGKQAEAYYCTFPLAGRDTVWFKPLKSTVNFHYIITKDKALKRAYIWVRQPSGSIFCFSYRSLEGLRLQKFTDDLELYNKLPSFMRSTKWGDVPMTDAQQPHVLKILKIKPKDLKNLKISKLSASALMSHHFYSEQLKHIPRLLAHYAKP